MDTKEIILAIVLSTATGILATLIWKRLVGSSKRELQFSTGDIADPRGFVLKLRDVKDSVSKYIWWRLPNSAQILVEEYDDSKAPSELLMEALVRVLNQLLPDQFLFEEMRFAHVPLRKETQKLFAEQPGDEDLVLFNRMVIEDAYPAELRRMPKRMRFDARLLAIVVTILVFVTIFGTGNSGASSSNSQPWQDVVNDPRAQAEQPSASLPGSTSAIGNTGKLGSIIKQRQILHVGESDGLEAPDNFTNVRLLLFKKNQTVVEILKSLERDPEFLKAVEELRALSPDQREVILTKAEVAYSPTWDELEMDPMINSRRELRRGQTRAGQTAERMIAEAIVNRTRSLL